MHCILKFNDKESLSPSDTLKKCKPGEIYKYEHVNGEYRVQVGKTVLVFPEKDFLRNFTLIKWMVRGNSLQEDNGVLSCGPAETMPDAKQRKMLRAAGYKIYVDGKLSKE